MTTQTAVLAAPTGLTLTAKLFTLAAPDTTAFTADSVTERTNAKGQYVASFGEESVISGDHTLILFSGTRPVAIGYRTFTGLDAEVATVTPGVAVLDTGALDPVLNAVADLQTDVDANTGYLTSIVSRLGAWTGTGVNTVLGAFKALLSKVATAPSDIGGTFDPANDSTEAIRDRGDVAWITGAGGSGGGSPVFTAVVVARIATGSAAGWPEDFFIGDAYLSANASAQPLFIKDVDDNILSGLGTKLFSDADFVATLRLAPLTDGTRTLDSPPTTIEVKSTDVVGIVYNDDTAGAEYFELQIPRAKTLLGVTKTKYSCQFIMNWGEDETFERTVNLGEIKFLRKNAAGA